MTEKQMDVMGLGRRSAMRVTAAAFLMAGSLAVAGAQTGTQKYPVPGTNFPTAPQLQIPQLPAPQPITPNGQVVEDVIARVNDRVITRSEYERAQQGILQEAKQQNASAADYDDRQKNLLRDMIDQQLLLSKGKDLGITGDAETLRQLDEIRKQNHLDSMEALQKAAEGLASLAGGAVEGEGQRGHGMLSSRGPAVDGPRFLFERHPACAVDG